jgi:pyridoxal phosphate enzyme (YggS family)
MSSRIVELEENLRLVQSEIDQFSPTLIVVTKTYPVTDVEILHNLGVRDFGENRSSEGLEKSESVPATWHYQGAIQSKKIGEILSWADYIHSLDNLAHAQKISRNCLAAEKQSSLFLQLSLDGDPTRGGVIESDLFALATAVRELPGISILGLMSVPPAERDPADAFGEIARVHQRFISEFPESPALSAGMSGDYLIALNHGATHIRVGSKILGPRQYH